MVHCFSFDNDYYLYDVASGSLHKCDALTCQVINKIQGLPYYFGDVEQEVINEIESEILALKQQGLLLGEDNPVVPPKSEYVKALCLHICHDCNLRCSYCFAGTGTFKGEREFMSEEVALANGKVYVIFENACAKYKTFTRHKNTSAYSFDVADLIAA